MKNTNRKNRGIKVMIGAFAAAVTMTAATVLIASADSGNIDHAPEAPVQTEAQVCADNASCDVPAGRYTDVGGSIASLNIRDNGSGTASCKVNVGNVFGVSYVYEFDAEMNGDELTYDKGVLNAESYDSEGNVTDVRTLSEGHSGKITPSDTGLVWKDSDGTSFVFIGEELMK